MILLVHVVVVTHQVVLIQLIQQILLTQLQVTLVKPSVEQQLVMAVFIPSHQVQKFGVVLLT